MKSKLPHIRPYLPFFKRTLLAVFIVASAFLSAFSYTDKVSAGWSEGLNSFVSVLVGSEQVSANVALPRSSAFNSQNLPLLEAPVAINPGAKILTEAVPIEGGEALSPDIAEANTLMGEESMQISTYTVRSGDTISGIAKMFKVSVNTILWANDLTSSSVLKAGQTLVVLPVTGVTYTVQKNDTISSIASKLHADPTDIYNYNDLVPSSKLVVGQTLIIPDAELPVSDTPVSRGRITKAPYEPVLGDISSLPSYPGYYSCPVVGRLSQALHGHNGIDLAAPVGAPIRASAAGTVIIAKTNGAWNGGYGNYIVISHKNGSQTLYAHMSKEIVGTGETVSGGQTIGYIGMTGLTTGPHVHFEIRGAKNPFSNINCE